MGAMIERNRCSHCSLSWRVDSPHPLQRCSGSAVARVGAMIERNRCSHCSLSWRVDFHLSYFILPVKMTGDISISPVIFHFPHEPQHSQSISAGEGWNRFSQLKLCRLSRSLSHMKTSRHKEPCKRYCPITPHMQIRHLKAP